METTLVTLVDGKELDKGNVSLLVLLDLSAAFDIIHHGIILACIKQTFLYFLVKYLLLWILCEIYYVQFSFGWDTENCSGLSSHVDSTQGAREWATSICGGLLICGLLCDVDS